MRPGGRPIPTRFEYVKIDVFLRIKQFLQHNWSSGSEVTSPQSLGVSAIFSAPCGSDMYTFEWTVLHITSTESQQNWNRSEVLGGPCVCQILRGSVHGEQSISSFSLVVANLSTPTPAKFVART